MSLLSKLAEEQEVLGNLLRTELFDSPQKQAEMFGRYKTIKSIFFLVEDNLTLNKGTDDILKVLKKQKDYFLKLYLIAEVGSVRES